jgi:toxin-antitoxin system PIN domain toxin
MGVTMLITDVNILVGAHRSVIDSHVELRLWLQDSLAGPEVVGVSELILSAFLRLVTNHRIFASPTPVATALDFCEVIRGGPASVIIRPGERHWSIFSELCRVTPARGNLVPDAYLAALAIENGATFVTRDRGFARFAGVRLADPLS